MSLRCRSFSSWLSVATVVLAGGLLAAPAAHAGFVASGKDPAGDAAHPAPENDLVSVGLAYDRRAGSLRAAVRLRGAPTGESPGNLTVFAGTRTAAGCTAYPAVGFGTLTDISDADWVRLNGPGQAPIHLAAGKSFGKSRAEQEFEATSRKLAGLKPNCVVATISDPQNTANVYDQAGPFRLRAVPELQIQVSAPRGALTVGRSRKVRVTVRNTGDASTGRIRLKVRRAGGLTARLGGTMKSVAAGKRRRATVTVTLGRRAKPATTLRVTATARGGLKVHDETTLYRKARSAGGGSGSGSGGGTSTGPKLCYRYTWLPPYGMLVPC